MRYRRLAALGMVFALSFAACGGGTVDESNGNQSFDVASLELSDSGSAGLDLYVSKCSTCHRANLNGGTGPALDPASASATKPIGDLRSTIVDGGNGMPAWGGLLSDQELDDLMTFLTEAQGR